MKREPGLRVVARVALGSFGGIVCAIAIAWACAALSHISMLAAAPERERTGPWPDHLSGSWMRPRAELPVAHGFGAEVTELRAAGIGDLRTETLLVYRYRFGWPLSVAWYDEYQFPGSNSEFRGIKELEELTRSAGFAAGGKLPAALAGQPTALGTPRRIPLAPLPVIWLHALVGVVVIESAAVLLRRQK